VIPGMNSPFPAGFIDDKITGMFRMLTAFAAQYAAFLLIVLSPDATPEHRGLVANQNQTTVLIGQQFKIAVV
jgi:hypothetical protein